jgi:hypothetical protein
MIYCTESHSHFIEMTSTTITRIRVDRMDMFSNFFISLFLVSTKVEIKMKYQNLLVSLTYKKISVVHIYSSCINKLKQINRFEQQDLNIDSSKAPKYSLSKSGKRSRKKTSSIHNRITHQLSITIRCYSLPFRGVCLGCLPSPQTTASPL